MKKTILSITIILLIVITSAFSPIGSKLVSKKGHVNFFSHTAIEDITADNYKLVSTLDTETGELIYTVPMQSFEFEKSLMQKHFNSDKFLDTKRYPKSKFKGMITNLSEVDFGSDGVYNAKISGDLTLHGKTKSITEKANITVANGTITIYVIMNITLADYGVVFTKGKPSKNIAKTVKATLKAIYN